MTDLLPRRRARLAVRRGLLGGVSTADSDCRNAGVAPETFRILYLAHCFRDKGLFETIDGVAMARAHLRDLKSPLRLHLTIAGDFASDDDRNAFIERITLPDITGCVTFAGFVSGIEKLTLLRESDCLCFPTYFTHESFGLVVLEAMAAGLPVIATRWRALPEILPPSYPGFVPIRDASAISRMIAQLFTFDGVVLREAFLARFTDEAHLHRLKSVLLRVSAVA